jgi:hypothetical protein
MSSFNVQMVSLNGRKKSQEREEREAGRGRMREARGSV